MQLEELFMYKNELMQILCSNEQIVKLVTSSDTVVVPCYDLAYTKIFPYEYIPETVSEADTYICFDVDINGIFGNKTFYSPTIYIWVICHKSKMRLPNGEGVRTDQIASEIDKELNGNRNFGLGALNLESVLRFEPILDYLGRVLIYKAKDTNRLGVNKKEVPVVRKEYV